MHLKYIVKESILDKKIEVVMTVEELALITIAVGSSTDKEVLKTVSNSIYDRGVLSKQSKRIENLGYDGLTLYGKLKKIIEEIED